MIKILIAKAIAKHGAKKLMLTVIGQVVKASKSKKDDEIFEKIKELASQL
jgi:hypothetical protein|tara:strand:+ start:647 stop:796 length:150 start_codon:yes stop_codon:yes gene_type:complete